MAARSCLRRGILLARTYSTRDRTFQEVTIPMPWGHIAGKWWEPFDKRPILALHGWQDSCGSFDRLIPLLTNEVGVLAIDLPGHGHSSRLPPGAHYHSMDQPILIRKLAKYFNWPKISLMGHSMGGISVYTHTMLFPHTVDFIICLDGVKPLYKHNNLERLARGMSEQLKYDSLGTDSNEPPSYPLEEIKAKLSAMNNNSIDIKYVHHILERNVAPSKQHAGQFYVTRDPRLKASMGLNWPQHDLLDGALRFHPPIFVAKFKGSGYFEKSNAEFYELLEILKQKSKDCQYYYIDGTHHTHLNNPESFYELLNEFIEKHDVDDRTVGGLLTQ